MSGKKKQENKECVTCVDDYDEGTIYIERDNLILSDYKIGGISSIGHFWVLCPVIKYYNKWYAVNVGESKFVWDKGSNKVSFLVRMMWERGASYEEVELKKGGDYGL